MKLISGYKRKSFQLHLKLCPNKRKQCSQSPPHPQYKTFLYLCLLPSFFPSQVVHCPPLCAETPIYTDWLTTGPWRVHTFPWQGFSLKVIIRGVVVSLRRFWWVSKQLNRSYSKYIFTGKMPSIGRWVTFHKYLVFFFFQERQFGALISCPQDSLRKEGGKGAQGGLMVLIVLPRASGLLRRIDCGCICQSWILWDS